MKERTIKVYGKFQRRRWKPDGFYPLITLSGKWVQDAGFAMGKQVFIKVENGKMIITNAE